MDCNEVMDQLSEYLDEDARAELCRVIEEHMAGCPHCRVYVDSVKKTIVLYQADSDRKIELPVRVQDSLNQVLAKEYGRDAEAAKAD